MILFHAVNKIKEVWKVTQPNCRVTTSIVGRISFSNFAARFHTIITVADETEVTRCELAALLPASIVRNYHLNSPGTFFLFFFFLCALETIHSGLEQIICAITEYWQEMEPGLDLTQSWHCDSSSHVHTR